MICNSFLCKVLHVRKTATAYQDMSADFYHMNKYCTLRKNSDLYIPQTFLGHSACIRYIGHKLYILMDLLLTRSVILLITCCISFFHPILENDSANNCEKCFMPRAPPEQARTNQIYCLSA